MGEERVVVELAIEDGLGATVNDQLRVTSVHPGSAAVGRLDVGDVIVELNDQPLHHLDHLWQLLRRGSTNRLVVLRRPYAALENLERMRRVQRRDGFGYHSVRIDWQRGGPRLGLGIRHFQNRVLVSRTDKDSLSAAVLNIGDHLIDVNGALVSDKDAVKRQLLGQLGAKGFVTSIVERPDSPAARQWTRQALDSSDQQRPGLMPADVQNIVARERERMRYTADRPAPPSIFRPAGRHQRVAFHAQHAEVRIQSDHEGKSLRPIRRR